MFTQWILTTVLSHHRKPTEKSNGLNPPLKALYFDLYRKQDSFQQYRMIWLFYCWKCGLSAQVQILIERSFKVFPIVKVSSIKIFSLYQVQILEEFQIGKIHLCYPDQYACNDYTKAIHALVSFSGQSFLVNYRMQ